MYTYIHIYIYICIYMLAAREVTVHGATEQDITVSFHNFKSPNFKLSVSNPKS